MLNELIINIDRIHTTELGKIRIYKNLSLQIQLDDIVSWCKEKIISSDAIITKKGKNWYVIVENLILTINAKSFTIITAHKVNKKFPN